MAQGVVVVAELFKVHQAVGLDVDSHQPGH